MNRISVLSFVVVVGGTAILLAGTAQSQSGVPKNQVVLQPTTPGTSQSGHSNITGTSRAGQFVGGGAGLTNVNADLLDGLNSTSFLQAVPNPLNLSGSNANAIIQGTNSNTTDGAAGVKGISSGSGFEVSGVSGIANGSNGRGVYGQTTGNGAFAYGGYFESMADGIGLYAAHRGSGDSYAIMGVTGSNTGVGVFGYASGNFPTGPSVGVLGRTLSSGGMGVRGDASVINGINFGGYFTSAGDQGYGLFATAAGFYGVFGECTAATGVTYGGRFENSSTSGRGVFAVATDTAVGSVIYGVRGQASTASSGYGVYAVGDMGASGVKPFRIDHPADPENKYLLHYSSESPFPQNFYSGNVTTDAAGYAWVDLPDYFGEINANFKYQLTVIGKTFAQAIVTEEVKENRFQIRTNQPNIKVSWRLEADRNDARIQWNRPTDVVEKVDAERGKYQHPEYYNQPASKGMDYNAQQEAARAKSKLSSHSKIPK